MINILHLGKYYYPFNGGIENVTQTLAEAFADRNASTTVICNHPYENSIENINNVKVFKSKINFTIMSQPFSFAYMLNCINLIRKSDVVQLHYPNIFACMIALLLPCKRLIIHWHSDVIGKKILSPLFIPLEILILLKSDSIIATSSSYVNGSIIKYFKQKLSIIPIGLKDLSHINVSATSEKLTNKLKEINNDKIILSVGRLVSYKNFSTLIDAMQYLDASTSLLIVGTGPLRAKLESHIFLLNLSNRVHLLGSLSFNDIQNLYRRATIFVLPSSTRAEAFGVVLLEAMMNGIPIIATNIPNSGVSWVNQHNVSGFNVASYSSSMFASSIQSLLSDEPLYKKLSAGARSRYESEFTDEIFVKRFLKEYNKKISNFNEVIL